nr:MAG TPA: hypothetical protein [Caudoviricetes sp.]DAN13252.1 MAG TPA: hypothetical protein [Bacteriophage sp.]
MRLLLSVVFLTKTVRGPSQKLLYQIKKESHRSQGRYRRLNGR